MGIEARVGRLGHAVNKGAELAFGSIHEPIKVKKLLSLIGYETPTSSSFEQLIGEALGMTTGTSDRTTAVVEYLQGGDYTYVLTIGANCEVPPDLIMQVGKRSASEPKGETVLKDFDNLELIEGIMGPIYTPRTYGKSMIDLPGIPAAPVIFTEPLVGYHEINNLNWAGIPGDCYTNVPDGVTFSKEGSKSLTQEMAAVLAAIYIGTQEGMHDSLLDKGLVVLGADIDRGDFVHRSFQAVNRPEVKLVTVRELEFATPDEFLTSVLSPNKVYIDQFLKGIYFGSLVQGVGSEAYDIVVRGMYEGISRYLDPDKAKVMIRRTLSEYAENSRRKVDNTFRAVRSGAISSIDQIPPGYRNLIKYHALGNLLRRRMTKEHSGKQIDEEDEAGVLKMIDSDIVHKNVLRRIKYDAKMLGRLMSNPLFSNRLSHLQ